VWQLEGPTGPTETHVRGALGGDDFLFVRAAALSGAGIALLPRMIATDDFLAGRLVRILPQYTWRGAALYIVYAAARSLPAKIRAFRDHVLHACSTLTRPDSPVSARPERRRSTAP
jgi:DNA-binding transcriptional LysR family regulator